MASERAERARPYPHQVGGHGQLAVTGDGRVLKPSSEKEYDFYSYIHSDDLPHPMQWIRRITPHFFGEADFPEMHDTPASPVRPSVHHHALPPCSAAAPAVSQSPHSQLLPSPSAQPSTPPKSPKEPKSPKLRWRTTDGRNDFHISPWAAQMGTRWKQSSKNPARRPRPSIALEDINSAFALPCVMDCKIGTRHYDDDASVEKRRRHILKANSTTTAKCGVRYTGMQSFKRELCNESRRGMFEVRDKYHGRTLTEPDLVPEATWFFHDNHRVRVECVIQILEKLRELRRLVVAQHHFFFYSSSLLLVYEGALPDAHPPRVDVRMIDFAHTVLSHGRRDDGYVHGIDYLISIMERILENHRTGSTMLPERPGSAVTADPRVGGSPIGSLSDVQAGRPGEDEHDCGDVNINGSGSSSSYNPSPHRPEIAEIVGAAGHAEMAGSPAEMAESPVS